MATPLLPLERTLSGVFHTDAQGRPFSHSQSTLDIAQRRIQAERERPDWPTRGMSLVKKTSLLLEATSGFTRGFAVGYVGKVIETLLFGLIGKARNKPLELLRLAFGKDALRFGLFWGVWCAVVRFVNRGMFLARGGVDDRMNALVAGAVGGLALLVDNEEERRRGVAVFVMVRGMSVLIRMLARLRHIPYWKHAEMGFFGLVNGPIMYSFLLEPDVMDPGYYKWILGMGAVTHSGLKSTLRDRREHFFKTGELLPFTPCQPHYHEGPCTVYCLYDWFLGLGRASKIYAPVHIIPILLFRRKQFMTDPGKVLMELARGILLSSCFLSTYQFTVKFVNCTFRNIIQRDEVAVAVLSGLCTGFSCMFERPSRVSELMLYCVPKSLDVVWNYGRKHHGNIFHPVPYFEVPLFMFGSAMLLSMSRQDTNSTYWNAVKFIVGANRREEQLEEQEQKERRRLDDAPEDHDHNHDDEE